jgi:hypothetical protein
MRGLSINFHFLASMSNLYIPTIGLPILLLTNSKHLSVQNMFVFVTYTLKVHKHEILKILKGL